MAIAGQFGLEELRKQLEEDQDYSNDNQATNRRKVTDWLKLNVGGTIFETTRSTLMSNPDSLLAKMFDPESAISPASMDEDGVYRIDSSPRAFEVILNWLRYKEVLLGDCSKEEVEHFARYFCLQDLIMELYVQPATLLISTTGPAAECHGDLCGVWMKAGQHNSRPYYKLHHTLETKFGRFL